MQKRIGWINWVLFLGILISGPIYVFLSKVNNFIPSVYIPSLALVFIFFLLIKNGKLDSIYGVYLHLGLWLNLLGEYYFYYHWVYYDKVLHFLIPLMITIFVYKHLEKRSHSVLKKFFVFLIVLGLGAFFEIFEYFQSGIFNFPSVGVYLDTTLVMAPYQDTIWDLIYNGLGSLVYLSFKDSLHIKNIFKRK